ncbi:hypothetical protein TCE0_018f06038 [Talaromyces pinophilus]|uniref:Major facilitator superfamily (MFS) profile domain-containing protein n=1 Tax=Talaromyces pinophilus TaxID=128442 RepID=A0A510NXE4_TALPI|nr:hypothetical protein TCE0_018f06038 [Talaromyces pinophilus]
MGRPTSPTHSNRPSQDGIEKQNASPTGPSPTSQLGKPPGPPGGPPGSQYAPRTAKFWIIMLCNYLSLFLVALDRTIITTAIPRITDEFSSLGDIGWYGSAYMLASAISQPLFGRIYKFYDMKWVFMTNAVLFAAGSALCGAAPNSKAFIAGRAIAGFASAAIFSGSILIVIPLVPLHKRPMFQAVNGMIFGVASVLGPLIGGGFTDGASWRWCFYINLPIGAVSWIFMALVWHPAKSKREPAPIATHIKRLDPLGMSLLAPSIVSLLLALQWGGSTYAWNNARTIALFVVFGVLFLGFVAVQIWKPETATIPARIIKQRSIISTAVYILSVYSTMMLLIYYIPIWFQTVKLVSPVKSGIYTIPLVLSMVVSGFISGFITQKIGYYVPSMYTCPCLLAVGTALMSTFTISTGSSHWIGYQFICGFGLGLGTQNASLVIQRILPMTDMSIGFSLLLLLQQLGGAVFTCVGETVLNNVLISQLAGVPGIDANAIVDQGITDWASVVPGQYMVEVQRAYNKAFSSLGLEWKSIKKGKNGPGNGSTEKTVSSDEKRKEDKKEPTEGNAKK